MTQVFRRISTPDLADENDIVVTIARAGGTAKARIRLPKSTGVARSLEFVSLEEAANRARAASDQYDLPLAVAIDPDSGLSWQPGWGSYFDL